MTDRDIVPQEGGTGNARPGLAKAVLAPAAAGCGLGCLIVLGLGALALYTGLCFIWTSSVPMGATITFSIVLVTACVFRIANKRAPWKLFIAEICVIAALWVGFSVWYGPRSVFKTCFLKQIPPGVVIHRAHHLQAGPDGMAWIHFSASPDVITSIIRSNNLSVLADRDDGNSSSGVTPMTPGWWNPETLSLPTLYFCEHISSNVTHNPWVIGIWVNSETNEAFGYVY